MNTLVLGHLLEAVSRLGPHRFPSASLLRDPHAHGHDLIPEAARIDCRDGPGVTGIRKLILLFPRDPVLVCEVLGRHPHGEGPVDLFGLRSGLALGVWIKQFAVPGLVAVARIPKVVGGGAHALDAAGNDHVAVPCLDLPHGIQNGLQA